MLVCILLLSIYMDRFPMHFVYFIQYEADE